MQAEQAHPTLRWPAGPAYPVLEAGAVHVWAALLDRPADKTQALRRLLAPDEQARADRFRFDVHRDRYIVARGVLRTLLGRYLAVPPQRVQFVYSAHDKPSLPGGQLAFNVSHSQQVGLFAFCPETAVGVDVEQIRPMPDGEEIAARFFSADDNARFLAVPPAQRDLAFFNCWTRKEAFIKAIGEGLSHPLDVFDVTLQPDEPARILRLHGRAELAARWSLIHLDPADGFVGALALEASPRQVVTYRWE